MNAMERLSSYISRGVYTVSGPFHPFGGAVDIIVVQQPDGSFKSSPWYVKFGKFQGVLKTKEQVVNITVNGVEAEFHMYLNHKGEAYFLEELYGEEGDSVISPPSSCDETEEKSQSGRIINKSKSDVLDANQIRSVASTDGGKAKVLTKTRSRRSGILGLVFGRNSMKDDGNRNAGSIVGAERTTSLERAEIAADLLEVKWSTNLSTTVPRMDNASRFSVPVDEADKDLQATNDQIPGSPSLHDSIGNDSDFSTTNVETDLCNNGSGLNNPESPNDVISPKELRLITEEQCMKISTLEMFDTDGQCEVISEVSTIINKFRVENGVYEERAEGSVTKTIPDLVELEGGQSTHSGVVQSSNEISTILSSGILEEVTGNGNFRSYVSTVGMNGSFQQATEALEVCYGGCKEVEPLSHVLYQTTELIAEVTLHPDSRVLAVEENITDTGIVGDGNFSEFLNAQTVHENESTSDDSIGDSLISCNLYVANSNSVETETLQVNNQYNVTESLSQSDNLGTELVKVLENELQIIDLSCSRISENDEVVLERPSKVLVSLNQEAGVNESIDLLEEAVSQSMCNATDVSSLIQVQFKENVGLEKTKEHCPSLDFVSNTQKPLFDSVPVKDEASPPSESLEEDQLLFGEINGLDPRGVQCKESVSQESIKIENYPSFTLDGIEEVHETVNINHDSSLSRGKLAEKYPASSFEGLVGESGTRSSPINIPKIHKVSGEEGLQLPESLPIIRSHIDSLEKSDALHPLSHSLDSNSGNLRLGFLGQEVWSSLKPDADSEHSVAHKHPRILDTRAFEELKLASTSSKVGDPARAVAQSGGSWRLWPFQFRKSRTMNSVQLALDDPKGSNASDCAGDNIKDKNAPKTKVNKKKVRILIPTSEQLASLNLKEGQNMITFTFSTTMLGMQQVDARIYLWKWNTHIVVSDVDGTITKSDVLGQFMPLVGKDWSQTGVAHLFSAIKENGYQLLFLSARSISQAYLTRQFLVNLKQDGKVLPDGPIVISPDGLFPSLYREVIRRAPHEFKIACLENIRALFPPDCNPFYAGFGNRDTDEISYLKVGIPKGKIFIINPKGQVAVNRWIDRKSYRSLHTLVNGMFPAMSSAEQEDFNSWNYWKMPLPEINV